MSIKGGKSEKKKIIMYMQKASQNSQDVIFRTLRYFTISFSSSQQVFRKNSLSIQNRI